MWNLSRKMENYIASESRRTSFNYFASKETGEIFISIDFEMFKSCMNRRIREQLVVLLMTLIFVYVMPLWWLK